MNKATENYLATGTSVCGEEKQSEIDRVLEHIVESAKNIAPEEVEELSKDVEGLKVAFAEWRQENAK